MEISSHWICTPALMELLCCQVVLSESVVTFMLLHLWWVQSCGVRCTSVRMHISDSCHSPTLQQLTLLHSLTLVSSSIFIWYLYKLRSSTSLHSGQLVGAALLPRTYLNLPAICWIIIFHTSNISVLKVRELWIITTHFLNKNNIAETIHPSHACANSPITFFHSFVDWVGLNVPWARSQRFETPTKRTWGGPFLAPPPPEAQNWR